VSGNTREEIYQHWEEASRRDHDADGLVATARDPYLQDVVESIIEKSIGGDMKLLDVGCGNGASTLRFAGTARSAVGVDYVSGYVERASAEAAHAGMRNTSFMVADVTDLEPVVARHGEFDVAISIRCLINLASWEDQQRGISEIAGCVRPGGLYVTSEGWQEGIDGLNLRRSRVGLSDLDVASYNRLMKRREFEECTRQYFDLVGYESIGSYLFLSRVLQPLYVAPEAPRSDHPINRVAAALQRAQAGPDGFSDCDFAGVYVLRRR
jgi:ubiquinone/menaquinone biosynthesis C-methylase UbiE